MQFKPHDRVVIGGRTMLRPGYSLVGMTATVFAVGGFVPLGHAQVIVDGEVVDEDNGSRVLIVNVPVVHLEHLTAAAAIEEAEAPKEVAAPAFTMVEKKKTSKTKIEKPEPVADGDAESGEPDKPFGLRLV